MLRIGRSLVVRLRIGAAVLLTSILSLLAAPASAQSPVFFGDTISDPGIYFLAGNQTGGGDGIVIDSDDVVLLLTRFTLRGDGTGSGIGVEGHDNVHIYGGRITNFEIGILMRRCDGNEVKDTRIDHCRLSGLDIYTTDDSRFTRLRCDQNGEHGVQVFDCDDGRFLSIRSHDNDGDGFHIGYRVPAVSSLGSDAGSSRNRVNLCWAAYNGRDGIRVRDSDENEIAKNQCVNNDSVGIHLDTGFTHDAALTQNGPQDNEIRSNWCVFNRGGIVLEETATANTLHNNTALANFEDDMVDDNPAPPCANTWLVNFFLFRDGDGAACIF